MGRDERIKKREHENPNIEYEAIGGYLQDEMKYQDAEVQKGLYEICFKKGLKK